MNTTEVTHRNIAKMLCSALPIEGAEFGNKVEDYIEVIKRMPKESKVALRSAYIFSRQVPREEREDVFQELALAVLKAKTKDEKLGYAIARMDWKDWWRKYSIREHYSLDTVVENEEGTPTPLVELIVGETEFEFKLDGKLDAERIWNKLPSHIKPLIQKRLLGKALITRERVSLHRWVKSEGYKLLLN